MLRIYLEKNKFKKQLEVPNSYIIWLLGDVHSLSIFQVKVIYSKQWLGIERSERNLLKY